MGVARLNLPPLFPGILRRRYKRFLADVQLEDGTLITAHCPNTGAMTGCADPGSPVFVSVSDNQKRKYPHTLEMIKTPSGWVGVNTGRANSLVEEALRAGLIDLGGGIADLKPEAKIPGGHGRFDFSLTVNRTTIYIEVKSVTLMLDASTKLGAFPDAVSTRAEKHLQALRDQVAAGHRAVLIFCAQHTGIDVVTAAAKVQPSYACALQEAASEGVEIHAYGCAFDMATLSIERRLRLT